MGPGVPQGLLVAEAMHTQTPPAWCRSATLVPLLSEALAELRTEER